MFKADCTLSFLHSHQSLIGDKGFKAGSFDSTRTRTVSESLVMVVVVVVVVVVLVLLF